MPRPAMLMFNFKAGVARPRQEELLAMIGNWPEVKAAHHLNPRAKYDETARMGFVELTDGADLAAVGRQLSDMSEIEMVQAPAQRGL